ncbi:MAG: hypothetical protein HY293_20155 [Planctomycetes bacterium]|nr:hypothetical protein [Planctomycetota bacterium]
MRCPGLLAATLALTPAGCNDDSSPAVGQPLTVALLTTESVQAGSVTVSNSESTLRVEVAAGDGWTLEKVRVAAGTTPAHLPQTRKGEPVPERFPLRSKQEHGTDSAKFSVPLFVDPGTLLYFAVQADVRKKSVKENSGGGCDMESAWGAGTPFPKGKGATYFTYTVQKNQPATLVGMYRTYPQDAWGGAAGGAAGSHLSAHFAEAFPNGRTIGSPDGYTALFRSARAVADFLPQNGPAMAFEGSWIDPKAIGNGLAGETLALALNVGFDDQDPAFASGVQPLGDLVVAVPSSRCFGLRVREVLNLANQALAGRADPSDPSFDDLLDCARQINLTFENGTVDQGYVGLP